MTANNPGLATLQEFGEPVPAFVLPSLDGSGERRLEDYLTDKTGAVVVFWSAICAHCVRYDRYFNAFSASHPQLGFVAIASRRGETLGQMQNAVHARCLHFPILVDRSGAVALEWHAQQTPRCYLISGNRRLLYRGAVDNFKLPSDPEHIAHLESAVLSFLAGELIARRETASFGCAVESVYYRLPKFL